MKKNIYINEIFILKIFKKIFRWKIQFFKK